MTFRSLYFLINWKDYSNDESTWESEMSSEYVFKTIHQFYVDNFKALKLPTLGPVRRGGGALVRDIRNGNWL
jgi:hypothetical protein